jgi:hypothetical protein
VTANNTHRTITSALGEHLITLLTVAIIVLGLLTAYPALAAGTKGTADRAQERVNAPLVAAAYLEADSYPSTAQAAPPSSSTP